MKFSLQHYILIFILALILVPLSALSDTVAVGPVGVDSNVGVDVGATTSLTNETTNDTKIDTSTEVATGAGLQHKPLKKYLRKNKAHKPHMKAQSDATIAPATTDSKVEIDGRLTATDPHLATGAQSDPPVNRPDND